MTDPHATGSRAATLSYFESKFGKPKAEITAADVAWLLYEYFEGEGFWADTANAELHELVVKFFGEALDV